MRQAYPDIGRTPRMPRHDHGLAGELLASFRGRDGSFSREWTFDDQPQKSDNWSATDMPFVEKLPIGTAPMAAIATDLLRSQLPTVSYFSVLGAPPFLIVWVWDEAVIPVESQQWLLPLKAVVAPRSDLSVIRRPIACPGDKTISQFTQSL